METMMWRKKASFYIQYIVLDNRLKETMPQSLLEATWLYNYLIWNFMWQLLILRQQNNLLLKRLVNAVLDFQYGSCFFTQCLQYQYGYSLHRADMKTDCWDKPKK